MTLLQKFKRLHYAWIILFAACVLGIVSRADSASFSVFIDPLVERFCWSHGDISFAYAIAFIAGGLIILWAEKREHTITIQNVDALGPMDALKLGLAQACALIPGTSRSGATIIGGLFFGLSRQAATEFSFFLAVPTLGAATLYQLYKERHLLAWDDLGLWIVGFVSAFASAFLCVRWLLRYISSHDFTIFAWYRIVFGIVVIATWQLGLVNWTAH